MQEPPGPELANASTDPALQAIETAVARPLTVLQTYHSPSALGIARTAPDLAAMNRRDLIDRADYGTSL